MSCRKIKRYGWRRSLPDFRDHLYVAPKLDKVPALVDLRSNCPPVYDQGDLGSCTGNATAGLFEFLLIKEKKTGFTPSRLFIYWHERVLEGSPADEDAGAELKDGIKTVATKGVCTETTWPYEINKFSVCPPKHAFAEANNHRLLKYQKLDNTSLSTLKACLASGFPFVLGFTVYESFESDAVAKTGVVPMPKKDENVLGGHAVLAVGYDDSKKALLIRNSWGTGWGIDGSGYFWMPYEYATSSELASDFWTGTLV